MRLLAEAARDQVIDMLGDVTPPAVAHPDERGKLAYLLAWSRVCADERAEQLQGTLGLLLAEPADEQLQPLPRCHASSLTANAITSRALRSSGCAGGGSKELTGAARAGPSAFTVRRPPLRLPRAVVVMLASMLAQLAEGRGITLMPSHAELTTVEAASMLNVSRPYLIKLIDSGELPARLVGRHRRIRFGDFIDYKRRTDASAHQAADDLIALSEEMGLYK